jgi:ABC-type antimicrobial peptide transport system permease subunit
MIAAIAALALLSVQSPVLAQISSISLLEHSLLGTRYSNWWRTLVQITSKIPVAIAKSINPKLKTLLHQVLDLCMINRDT